MQARSFSIATIVRASFIAALHAVAFVLSHALAHRAGDISPVWVPSGLALSYVLLGGPWYAVAAFVGTFAGSAYVGESQSAVPYVAVANAVEAYVGWWLMRRLVTGPSFLSRASVVLRFLLVAFAATAVGAAIGVVATAQLGWVRVPGLFDAWRLWWLGNALGVVMVTPAIVSWRGRSPATPLVREVVAALGVAVISGGLAAAAFFAPQGAETRAGIFSLMVLPVLIWAGMRLGMRAVTAGVLVVSLIATIGTMTGLGPYGAYANLQTQQISLQLYILVASTSVLLLAATVAERDATLLEQRRAETALTALARGVSTATGEEFFRSLVREVGSTLGVKFVLAGEIIEPERKRVRTIAQWIDGEIAANIEYDLDGTPCSGIIGRQTCVYERNVAALFPKDVWLKEMSVESYLGVPLFTADRTPLGLLVAMDDRPLTDVQRASAMLSVYADRAASELQRLRAMGELELSQARLSLIYNAVQDRLSLWSIDSQSVPRLVSMNRASIAEIRLRSGDNGNALAARIGSSYGDQLKNRLDGMHLSSDEQARSISELHASHLDLLLRERRPVTFREAIRDDQVTSIADVTLTPVLDLAGEITHVLRSMRDVTEQVVSDERSQELEATLRQTQRMEAIGTLAGGIAHDFNNILTGMLGYAELARLELEPTDTVSEYLGEVVSAVHRARDLVRQILTFSRRSESEQTQVALASVVREAMQLLRASLPSTIDVTFTCTAEDAVVTGDPSQLHQVVMNLGTNAFQAIGKDGGSIDIVQDLIEVDEQSGARDNIEPGVFVRLTVHDSGSGMTPATIERIFEPFFTTKRPGEGTGLGLAVVHGIVRGHHGTIRVTSTPGSGSTFQVLLPLSASAVLLSSGASGPAPQGHGEHVLIVDDEASVVAIARLTLKQLGYRVTAIGNAAEALVAFGGASGSFDLVVSDLTMPEIPGNRLVPMLRAIRRGIPIILTSGHPGALTAEALRELDVCHVLQKPFTREMLARAVRDALDHAASPVGSNA